MSPKKAIIILAIFTLAITGLTAYLYTKQQKVDELAEAVIPPDANVKIEQAGLTAEQREELLIEQKVEEKREAIEIEAKDRPYTQEEIDFILNPRKTVEEDLGLRQSEQTVTTAAPVIMTQEEIDSILNPKK